MNVYIFDFVSVLFEKIIDAVNGRPGTKNIFGAHVGRTVLRKIVVNRPVDIGPAFREHLHRIFLLAEHIMHAHNRMFVGIVGVYESPRLCIRDVCAV